MDGQVVFSSHALSQFSKRVCVEMIDTVQHIREVWQCAVEIDRDKAYELTGDKEILKKENDNSKYYEVMFSSPSVMAALKKRPTSYYQNLIGIFVVRDDTCVTFKTSVEKDIYNNLYKFRYTKRFYDIQGVSYE